MLRQQAGVKGAEQPRWVRVRGGRQEGTGSRLRCRRCSGTTPTAAWQSTGKAGRQAGSAPEGQAAPDWAEEQPGDAAAGHKRSGHLCRWRVKGGGEGSPAAWVPWRAHPARAEECSNAGYAGTACRLFTPLIPDNHQTNCSTCWYCQSTPAVPPCLKGGWCLHLARGADGLVGIAAHCHLWRAQRDRGEEAGRGAGWQAGRQAGRSPGGAPS
mgnify:CR=1 FL=1